MKCSDFFTIYQQMQIFFLTYFYQKKVKEQLNKTVLYFYRTAKPNIQYAMKKSSFLKSFS